MRSIVSLVLVGAIFASAAPAFAIADQDLPAAVVNGRFFYEPTIGSRRLRIWLDTDGEGFVTAQCVRALDLPVTQKNATLPPSIVQPTAFGGRLPVVDPDPQDKIFDGIDAQFGATWFQGRIVSFDYRTQRLRLVSNAGDAARGRLGRGVFRFSLGADGKRIDGAQYPRIDVAIDGTSRVEMGFDTAASVVLTPETANRLNDGSGAVRATSFLTHAAMRSLHGAHPSWPFIAAAGGAGIDMLRDPSVTLGTYRARNVWFSTRPNDDVFAGETVAGKIGPTAFGQLRVTLDYPAGRVYFDE